MSENLNSKLDVFMTYLKYWSWVHRFLRLDEKNLIVADEAFLAKLRGDYKSSLKCAITTPDKFRTAIGADIKRVIVFCMEHELGIVREIQREHPKVDVVSGTYGLAVAGPDRKAPMTNLETPSWPQINSSTVILSTPYADAEYLSRLMVNAGLPFCYEYLGKQIREWVAFAKPFHVARFYSLVAGQFAEDHSLNWMMQTDVLAALFSNTTLNQKRFIDHLLKTNAKVIILRRRDKLTQASMAQVLDRTPERSAWGTVWGKGIQGRYHEGDFTGSLDKLTQIDAGERLQDEIGSALGVTSTLYLEDIIADPNASVGKVADFLGLEMAQDPSFPHYGDAFKKSKDLAFSYKSFQREYIDRLGLHLA